MKKKDLKLEDGLEKMKTQIENFLNLTIEARENSERDRDYYDGYQWTEEEKKILQRRNQAPIVVNRVKPKVEGLKGLLDLRKTDIKSFPRNYKNDDKAAEAVTDALRYVFDNNDFDEVKRSCFENKVVEGYAAAIVEEYKRPDGESEIRIVQIPWDRFYFDTASVRKDFKDARYMGQMIWVDKDQLQELFPDKKGDLENYVAPDTDIDETFEDKPRWHVGSKDRPRFRIAHHFYIDDGEWKECIFMENLYLLEPRTSPYLDEFGKPTNPIEADTAYIDRNNNRYGEVRAYVSQQDEINHRRSKALHLLSSRQTMAKQGAIQDVEKLKRELAKPDGHVQYNGDQGDFQLLNTNDFTQGQFTLYQDAKSELDATSFNAQLSGERQSGELSGRAIEKLQSAGSLEINSLYSGTNNWEKRIARQVWGRIKQFWSREKWIRVTDDQDNLRWIGLNSQVTFQQMLEELSQDESKPLEMRVGAIATLQAMMQGQDPRLQAIVDVKNNTAELDLDIILEQSFDTVNIQQEQFQLLAQFASGSDIDLIDLIELSQLRNKDQLIEKIEQRRQAASQAAMGVQQSQMQEMQVKNAKTYADAQVSTQKANQMAIENQLLIQNPPQQVTQVSV